MFRRGLSVTASVGTFGLLLGLIGCSENPIRTSLQSNQSDDHARVLPSEGAAESEFGGRIEFVDTATSLFKLVEDNRQIFVAPNGALLQRTEDADVIILLAAIRPGDSVEINGSDQGNGTILASRVRVRLDESENGFRAEVTFRTTVLSIDYANATLLTAFCWQVRTDSMTYIFGSRKSEDAASGSNSGAAAKSGPGVDPVDSTRFRIAFSDLRVGDTIEVNGNHLPNGTIYGVAIELEDVTMESRPAFEFTDVIASTDQNTRTVTFEGDGRAAVVDWMADLCGPDHEAVTFGDFAPGMRVEVKGFVGTGGLVSVVRMCQDQTI